MNLDEMLIRVHAGDGLVARHQGVALVVFAPGASQQLVTDELLRVVEASAHAAPPPGRRLGRQVVRLIADADPDAVPSFGLLAEADTGLVLLLHGNADADVARAGGEEHLSGRDVATWVDRIVQPPIDGLVLRPSGQTLPPADPRFQLRAGVVPGAGLSVIAGGAPQAPVAGTPADEAAAAPVAAGAPVAAPSVPPPPGPAVLPVEEEPPSVATKVDMGPAPRASIRGDPEPAPPRSFVSVSLIGVEPEEVREPLPVVDAPEMLEPEGPKVKGVVCSRGHFNDPDAPFCAVCGISMVQRTLNLVDGPRPPLGVLVFDDGATFTVDNDYVLGREPESDPDVVSGKARPLALTDPERTVSRVHAALVLQDWSVRLVDRGSANGTYLAPPGRDDWAPVLPNQPTTIKPGTRVRLGQRVALYDSHGGKR